MFRAATWRIFFAKMMREDCQCCHLCPWCEREHFHVIASPCAPLDPWERPCDQCVTAGKVRQITQREKSAVSEEVSSNEEVRTFPLGPARCTRSLASTEWPVFDDLLLLREREVTAETI